MTNEIKIYTDGGSLGNPGPGGYGAVLLYGEMRKEISGGYRFTTNNRMELTAVIKALGTLKNVNEKRIQIYTDSKLIYDAFNSNWIYSWEKKGWKKSNKEPVLNDDLWKDLLSLVRKYDVNFNWVKAHIGIEENEICDALVKEAAKSDKLGIDHVYEGINNQTVDNNFRLDLNSKEYFLYDKHNNYIKFDKNDIHDVIDILTKG